MKRKIAFSIFSLIVGCGPDRSFSDKNIFGSQNAVASTATGSTEKEWPKGNRGVGLTQVIPEDLQWFGYVEHQESTNATTVSSWDWYDPTGDSGINAVIVITAKQDCAKCLEEAKFLQNNLSAWKSKDMGIKAITLVIDDVMAKPATVDTALKWKTSNYQVDAVVAADPLAIMLPENVLAMPYHTIINPRSMTVVSTQEGIINDYNGLEDLALLNKQY